MKNRILKFRCFYENEVYQVKEMTFNSDGSFSVTLNKLDGGGLMDIYPDPEHIKSVMQFTGLLDKNGKEIYEGDRITFYRKGNFATAVIIFENGLFCLQHEDGYKNIYPLNPENYEVIGNVFEAPKL